MQLGIIGRPLGHSLSPQYFNRKFKDLGIEGNYQRFELTDITDLPAVLDANPELRGFNVTIPYKQEVMAYLDEIDPAAQAIGAVNTVRIAHLNGKRHLKGFNTDVIGFGQSLAEVLHPNVLQALVLGTGGASKAVCYALTEQGIDHRLVSRTSTNGCIAYGALTEELIRRNLLIVNTTPLGMTPKTDACPDLPYAYLTPDHILYDLIYTPQETLFLQKGKEQKAATINGVAMWKGQAEAAWQIWNDL